MCSKTQHTYTVGVSQSVINASLDDLTLLDFTYVAFSHLYSFYVTIIYLKKNFTTGK